MPRPIDRKHVQRNDDPAMTSRLPEPTIYDYDPIARHLGNAWDRMPAAADGITGSPYSLEILRPSPCWTGQCAGCGRWLVSATWPVDPPGRARKDVYCTRACRAVHDG